MKALLRARTHYITYNLISGTFNCMYSFVFMFGMYHKVKALKEIYFCVFQHNMLIFNVCFQHFKMLKLNFNIVKLFPQSANNTFKGHI